MPTGANDLLRQARLKAGLSQRDLARRADTAQSVVARIELGLTSPSFETLSRLLAAAGFEIDPQLGEAKGEPARALADVERILALKAEERLQGLRNVDRFLGAVSRA